MGYFSNYYEFHEPTALSGAFSFAISFFQGGDNTRLRVHCKLFGNIFSKLNVMYNFIRLVCNKNVFPTEN